MGMKTIVIPKLEFLVLNKNLKITYVGSYRLHGVEGDDASLLSLIRAFSAPG